MEPTQYLYMRETPATTLVDVRESLDSNTQTIQRASGEMQVDLLGDGVLAFTGSDITIPMTEQSVTALGNWLEVPGKFLGRLDADMQQDILNNLLQRRSATGNIVFDDAGIQVVRDPNSKFIEPRRVVDKVMAVMEPTSTVIDHQVTIDDFLLDVVVPEGFDRGIGGDPQVGDLTRGGIRVGMDIKHGLSPWVQPYMYRLWCTNGMETQDAGLRVDARGATVEEVLAEFEAMADRAFRRVEGEIEAFYELRAQRVDNPERAALP